MRSNPGKGEAPSPTVAIEKSPSTTVANFTLLMETELYFSANNNLLTRKRTKYTTRENGKTEKSWKDSFSWMMW